jgi:hypothetical protein
MDNLIVYQSSNFQNKFFRYYHLFFDKLIEELKANYIVKEDRYFEKANEIARLIKLSDSSEYNILECELLIENTTTNKIYLLSVCDLLSSCSVEIQKNKRLEKVLLCQYNFKEIEQNILPEYSNKFVPWIYFPYISNDLEYYRSKRNKEALKDELFFRTSSSWYRPLLSCIDTNILKNIEHIGGFDLYCNDAITHKIGLSLGGKGDLCYRDIEYLGLGIPFIRFKYNSTLSQPLLPNYHYISVDYPENNVRDKDGGEEYAELIKKRFLEIKDDNNLLNYISNNGYTYYNTYIKYPNNVVYTMQLLNL